MVNNTQELSEATEGMLFWENDLPMAVSREGLPSNLLLALGACDEDAFPNIHRLLLIACTLPISSAEAKRSFSLMKRIKTYTRLTMCEEHFSDLAIIAMHYSERFEVDEICEAFVKAHPRRLTRYVEKQQITIFNTAVPFNHAHIFLGFLLRNMINSRFYMIPSQIF